MKCVPWSPKQNAGIMMRWVVSRSHQEPSPLQDAVNRGTNVLYWSCIDFVGSSSIIMWGCPSVVWHKKKSENLYNTRPSDDVHPHFKNVEHASFDKLLLFQVYVSFCAAALRPVFENMRRRFPCARSALPVWRHDVQWRLRRAAETCRKGRLQPGALHTTDRSVVQYHADTLLLPVWSWLCKRWH